MNIFSGGAEAEGESHLLNVIVSLQGQELRCDVDRNKSRNINEFKQIDSKINKQITANYNTLKEIPKVYGGVLERIKFAQDKIKSCKDKIDRCKTSLQCQREDLKRLYLETVTNGQILELLGRINDVREVSGILDSFIKQKHYQRATKLLKTNVALLEGNLSSVEALKEIKDELKKRKDTLHLELIQQLQNHLYLKAPSSKEKVQLFRSGQPPEMDNEEEYVDEEEDVNKDPEEDSYKFLKLLIQSLQQLERLDETIEVIEKNMESELRNILNNTAQEMLYKKRLSNQIENVPTLFPDLLEECFAKYRAVAASHHVVINAIEHLRCNTPAKCYTNNIVWSKIQTCVEFLLRDYLAVNEDLAAPLPNTAPISYVTVKNDISMFYVRGARRPERLQSSLFSFECSATGLTRSSEGRSEQFSSLPANTTMELPTLCHKSPHNITLVFKQISGFIMEINNVITITGSECIPLQLFLNEFVDNKFLPTLIAKVKRDIAEATEGNSGLNMVKLPSSKIGWPRPLLQGTLKVQEELAELRALMNRMPKYCNKFLEIVYDVLKSYKKICQSTFSNIVGMNSVGMNTTVCHVWFKDEKLKQLIRELPLWNEMFEISSPDKGRVSTHSQLVSVISTHIGREVLEKDNTIVDSERLIQLAQLQDSISWLVQYVGTFIEHLAADKELQDQLTGNNVKLFEDCKIRLNERISELCQLSEDCLIILYLEIRVQCYYYLLTVLRKQKYNVEMVNSDPDSEISLLNKFLSQLEEKIREFLPVAHNKFLFEGLGYVMSTIIICNASHINEINNGGLKKMSRNILALQQNLTNITLTHELELERARLYYELLYQKPEEILRNIVEQQKRFTKTEYVELIRLYYRSNKSTKNNSKRSEKQLNLHLVKLNEIMENESDDSDNQTNGNS